MSLNHSNYIKPLFDKKNRHEYSDPKADISFLYEKITSAFLT